VVLYELLTGRVPYPSEDASEAMRQKAATEPPLVRRRRPDVPPTVEAIIYRALRRTTAERYASMADLHRDLDCPDAVTIPDYRPDVLPPRPVGDLPPWRTTIVILLVLFAVLVGLGVLAALSHGGLAHH
jgi:serine/threonine protein kinase